MPIETTIEDIVQKLREGRFPNEQSISQGIVLRVLRDLGWDVYDTKRVWPEYSTGDGRVDFALCAPPEEPKSLVEVKQPGKAEDGVKQALEYAFHTGAQFVTLTDGQTWSFYLPAVQGSYEDRRVFKLDLFERTEQESAETLRRYLEQESVASGEALETARKEYHNKNRRAAARQAIPAAWREIVEKGDQQLVDLLTDAVESKVGIRPDEKDILNFFEGLVAEDALDSSGPQFTPKRLKKKAQASIRPTPRKTKISSAKKDPEAAQKSRIWFATERFRCPFTARNSHMPMPRKRWFSYSVNLPKPIQPSCSVVINIRRSRGRKRRYVAKRACCRFVPK